MESLEIEPGVAGIKKGEGFVQTVRLVNEREVMGLGRWHATASTGEGTVQVLELGVAPPYRRKGHGGRILMEIVRQGKEYYKARKGKLRRVWMAIEQKQQVIARAFLTGQGFNHVGTAKELLKDQDMLVYMRTFD